MIPEGRIADLVAALLEGALGAEEERELCAALEADPELTRTVRALLVLDDALDQVADGARTCERFRAALATRLARNGDGTAGCVTEKLRRELTVPGSGTTARTAGDAEPSCHSAAVLDHGSPSTQPGTRNQEPGTPARRRAGWLFPAAAAAALIVVSGLFALDILPSGNVTIKDFGNTTGRVRSETLSDGTRLAIAPGAKLKAAGRDSARKVRQVIKLESGEVEIAAPKAVAGEVACRVETPEGLWVETVGTVFKVTRAWENEKGDRNVDRSKLTGAVLAAVLLVAVSEGEVRTGNAVAEEARVAAGQESAIKAGPAEKASRPFRIIGIPKTGSSYSSFDSTVIYTKAEFDGLLEKTGEQKGWSRYQEFADALAAAKIDFDKEALVLLRHTENSMSVRVELKPPELRAGILNCEIDQGRPTALPAMELFCFALAVSKAEVKGVVLSVGGKEKSRLAIGAPGGVAEKVSWGQAVNGLQMGLSAGERVFVAGERLEMQLRLRNTTRQRLSLEAEFGLTVEGARQSSVEFVCQPKSAPDKVSRGFMQLSPEDVPGRWPVALLAGQEVRVRSGAVGTYAGDAYSWRPLLLPPGRWLVTVHYFFPTEVEAPEAQGLKASSGPVEIEIVAQGKGLQAKVLSVEFGRLSTAGPLGTIIRLDKGSAHGVKPGAVFRGDGAEVTVKLADERESTCFIDKFNGGAAVKMPKVGQVLEAAKAEAPAAEGEWLTLLADQPAYKEKPGEEQLFTGRLDPLRPITELHNFAYALAPGDGTKERFTLGVGLLPALEKLKDSELAAGRMARVEVRGKIEKDVQLYKGDGGKGVVLWPAAVRLMPGPAAEAPTPARPLSSIAAACEKSPLVFVGKVVKADLDPTFWSGGFMSTRRVLYETEQALKGQAGKQVAVDVIVLMGSPLMAAGKGGKKEPRLDPQLFAVGARHLVCTDSTHEVQVLKDGKPAVDDGGRPVREEAFLLERNLWPATEENIKAAKAALAPPPASAAAEFSAKPQRPADKVAAEVADGALVLTVTSPGGIGSAEVKVEKGEWPKRVSVRLALKGLEGFTAECGGKKLSGFINSSGAKGGDLAAEKKGELIQVALPEGFASGKDAVLKLSWVDFYR